MRGAALAVTRNGKLVHARGYGFANLAKKQPVEPASLFHIASMSKPLTAVGVMTRRSAKVNITG